MDKDFKDHGQNDFREILRSAPDLYLILNSKFEIVEVSQAYLQATMVKRENILGCEIFDVFPNNPQDIYATGVENLRDSLERVLRNKTPDAMAVQKYDIRKPDSEGGGFEERYWSPFNSPVLGNDNEVKYIIHRAEDVTEFVRMKQVGSEQSKLMEELQTRAGQMEKAIFLRAQEIQETNKRLRISYEEVEKKNEELKNLYDKLDKLSRLKTQFFANVSHELRTPLTLIMGPVQKLAARPEFLDYKHDLTLIERNANTLLKLVNDLLDVAKLELGKAETNYSKVNLVKLVRQTASLFESYAEEREFNYIVETPSVLIAEVDADKIHRVILNLLSNAFKFTPSKGIVRCSLSSDDRNAKIIVADSGPGVSPDLREAIFERFFQAEEYSTRRFGGFGLGLAIVKDFIELHQGSIYIDNAQEGGAAFITEIPLKQKAGTFVKSGLQESRIEVNEVISSVIAELQSQEKKITQKGSEEQGEKPLILVIEDNVDMNQYICEILSGSYRTASAFDGKEGLQKALELHPDLIISDIMMPELSGVQLVPEIRSQAALLEAMIIIVTARDDDELYANMLSLGANDYLTKPFSYSELKIRVDNLINLKQAREDLKYKTAQLIHQEKIAALWNVTTGIAHEIKNPLNFVINCAELSLEELPEIIPFIKEHTPIEMADKILGALSSLQANLAIVLRHGQKAGMVIQKMMDHAMNKNEMLSFTDFNEFIQEAFIIIQQRLQKEFPKFKVETRITFDQSLPLINLNSVSMLKAFSALLNNAYYSLYQKRKAMGSFFIPTISIIIKNLGNQCEMRVKDNGLGIPDQLTEKVFVPFFSTKPTGEGVGLGLSLCYNVIVQEHGGTINFVNSVGDGIEFIITLPFT